MKLSIRLMYIEVTNKLLKKLTNVTIKPYKVTKNVHTIILHILILLESLSCEIPYKDSKYAYNAFISKLVYETSGAIHLLPNSMCATNSLFILFGITSI